MQLKPSDIFFSQDSINNVFDKRCAHSYEPIGHTLDALCTGRCKVSDIPTITVVEKDGTWVTADNRRLWVFREMERLGKCGKITVYEGYSIPSAKMTSYNGGTSVHVRGSPGGTWHNKPSARKSSASNVNRKKPTSLTNNFSTTIDQRNSRNDYTPASRLISPDTGTVSTYNNLINSNNHINHANNRSTVTTTNYTVREPVKTVRPSSSTSSNLYDWSRAGPGYTTTPRVGSATMTTPRVGAGYTAFPREGPGYGVTPRVSPAYPNTPTSYRSTDPRGNGRSRHEICSPSSSQYSNTRNSTEVRSILTSSSTTLSQRRKPADSGCCIIL